MEELYLLGNILKTEQQMLAVRCSNIKYLGKEVNFLKLFLKVTSRLRQVYKEWKS